MLGARTAYKKRLCSCC